MSYAFNADLIKNVLADQSFQQTGKYVGKVAPYRYVVIDPRRHNVNVWIKAQDDEFITTEKRRYRDSAARYATIFYSNGPPMQPPHFPGEGHLSGAMLIYAGFGYSVASNEPWEPYDAVRSGGKVLHSGRGNRKWVFERAGQGSYSVYRIVQGAAGGIEGLSGCYGIVSAGAVIDSEDHTGLKKKKGCAAWCKRPLSPALETKDWESSAQWYEEALDREGDPIPLNGLIIGVAVNVKPRQLASKIIEVGCTDAVAMDGSDSTLCGSDGSLRIECDEKKDLVQRWGLYCT